MATITLTKAARVQERLRETLREVKLEPSAAVSIFMDEPQTELDRLSQKLLLDVGRVEQLLAVLADLRAAVGRANAECGISVLLAEKASLDERVELLSKLLPGSAPKKDRYPLAADPEVRPRRSGEALMREIAAMRTRFSSAERGAPAASIEADLLDDAALETVRSKITTARRRLDEIGDRLRELNGTVTIVLADAALNFLRQEGVI